MNLRSSLPARFVRILFPGLAPCSLAGRMVDVRQFVKNRGIGLDQPSDALPVQLHRAITAGTLPSSRLPFASVSHDGEAPPVQRTQSARQVWSRYAGTTPQSPGVPGPASQQLGPQQAVVPVRGRRASRRPGQVHVMVEVDEDQGRRRCGIDGGTRTHRDNKARTWARRWLGWRSGWARCSGARRGRLRAVPRGIRFTSR